MKSSKLLFIFLSIIFNFTQSIAASPAENAIINSTLNMLEHEMFSYSCRAIGESNESTSESLIKDKIKKATAIETITVGSELIIKFTTEEHNYNNEKTHTVVTAQTAANRSIISSLTIEGSVYRAAKKIVLNIYKKEWLKIHDTLCTPTFYGIQELP